MAARAQLESEVTLSGVRTALGLAYDVVWVLLAGLWVYFAYGIRGATLPPPVAMLVAPTPGFLVVHKLCSVLFLLFAMFVAVFSDR